MINLETNNIKESQLDINFEKNDIDIDQERASKLIESLNLEYPFAKLRAEYVGNGDYSVGSVLVKEKDLKEKFRMANEIYRPSNEEKWYDK